MKMTVSMMGGAPRATRSLGAILIDSGQLTPEDAERVLQLQTPFGADIGASRHRPASFPEPRSLPPERTTSRL